MGYILLALFAITLFVLYIAVRRAWGQPLYLGSIGVILCAVFVMLFALIHEKTSTAQALLAGFVVGIAFPVVVVIIAVFFRTNQPAANVRIVSEPRSPQARASQSPPAGDEDTGPDA
jgi:F0F1-type ATP synthase assembly protein I